MPIMAPGFLDVAVILLLHDKSWAGRVVAAFVDNRDLVNRNMGDPVFVVA